MKREYIYDLIIHAIVLLLMSYIHMIYVDSFITALIVAFVISILNEFVKPILEIISIPFTLLTLGLFHLVINGFMFYLADLLLGSHFQITSVWMAILASIVMSMIVSFIGTGEEQ